MGLGKLAQGRTGTRLGALGGTGTKGCREQTGGTSTGGTGTGLGGPEGTGTGENWDRTGSRGSTGTGGNWEELGQDWGHWDCVKQAPASASQGLSLLQDTPTAPPLSVCLCPSVRVSSIRPCLSVCPRLSVRVSIRPCVHPSPMCRYLSICPCPRVRPSACLCPSVCLSVCPSVRLSVPVRPSSRPHFQQSTFQSSSQQG